MRVCGSIGTIGSVGKGRAIERDELRRNIQDGDDTASFTGGERVEQVHDVGDALCRLHAACPVEESVALGEVDRGGEQLGDDQPAAKDQHQTPEQGPGQEAHQFSPATGTART